MGPDIGRGIGEAMLVAFLLAALCLPTAIGGVIAFALMLFGYSLAAKIVMAGFIGLGCIAGLFIAKSA